MAEPQLSPQVQQQLQQLSMLNQQLQATLQQKAQMEAMKIEADEAAEALGALAADAVVYRGVGSLMVREDKTKAEERVKEESETLGIRINRIAKQEQALREQAGPLQQKIQAALGAQ